MIYFILFLLLLSAIVIVHEFGHLIAAKIFGVYCSEFSMGMGPKLLSYKGKETEYVLRLLPIGGFVAMAGDTDNELETKVDISNIPYDRTLPGIARWKRIIIMLAGIIMNVVLAVLIVAMVILHNGSYGVAPDTTIASVSEGLPAQQAGIMADDKIVKVSYDGLGISNEPKSFDDINAFMYGHEDLPLTITVERNGQKMSFEVIPEYDSQSDRYVIGINSKAIEYQNVNIFNCFIFAVDYLVYVTRTIFMSLTQLVRGIGLENLSGPVGIYQATSQAVDMGASSYFLMIAVLSLNVGIFNALPLPILDGGRVVILLVESIIRRPLSERAINFLMMFSLAVIVSLFLIATYQDVLRLF